ncbi:MAG TPA: hypothetical protein VHT68_14155 [Pseudolabrys sp.]|jgi:hypothetical protein|nr:hypothetical protein [Pseudolabrys sp.]
MISVVNGYVCTSSCDAAAAKQCKDPAASPGPVPGTSGKKNSGLDTHPASVLDGALKVLAANTSRASQPATAQQKVNLLA